MSLEILPAPATLYSRFEEGDLSEDDYLDSLLKGIKHSSAADPFLACVFELFYDAEHEEIKVATPPRDELRQTVQQLQSACKGLHDPELDAYLTLLSGLFDTSNDLLRIRWGLARLVGMAISARAAKST